MKRNSKLLLILIVIFVIITGTGAYYAFSKQNKELSIQNVKLERLRANFSTIEQIDLHLKSLEQKVNVVDSVLFSGKFNIPKNLPQSTFYNFIENYGGDRLQYTFTNTEYVTRGIENGFNFYVYKVSGNGEFDGVYGLIYAIEHNNDLMKIQSAEVNNNTSVDSKGVAKFLVKFDLVVKVYFSTSDQYASVNTPEGKIFKVSIPNAFYPQVRSDIRPNVSNLPNIQDGSLLSLVPQGAFISDTRGNTYLFKKGDPVYLGYLTDIDYDNETVTFTLNKGGIIETEVLKMGKPAKKQGK